MWCFVVLFTFLRTLSAPKLCVQHHYPVHIPFPSTQSSEEQLAASALGQLCRTLWFTSFDSAAVRDAQGEFLYKPQGASRHWFGWDTHGMWLVPVDVMAVTRLGTERPSPCPGAPASAFGSISWLLQRQWWEIPPSTPLAALPRSSQAELWGIVPFSTEGISRELLLILPGVPALRDTKSLFDWRLLGKHSKREKEHVSFWLCGPMW